MCLVKVLIQPKPAISAMPGCCPAMDWPKPSLGRTGTKTSRLFLCKHCDLEPGKKISDPPHMLATGLEREPFPDWRGLVRGCVIFCQYQALVAKRLAKLLAKPLTKRFSIWFFSVSQQLQQAFQQTFQQVLAWTEGRCVWGFRSFKRVLLADRLAIPPTTAWVFFWNGMWDCNPPKPEQHLLRASILQRMDPSKSSKLRQANLQGTLTRQQIVF